MKAAHISAKEVCEKTLAMQTELQHNYGCVWRAESYRVTEGLSMTMRRAIALNAVLENCRLPLIPGELLIGSGLGVWTKDGDAEEVKKAQEQLAPFNTRHFGSNSDHSAPDYAKLLRVGIGGLRSEAEESLKRHTEAERKEFLRSVIVALDGAEKHLVRWADAVEQSIAANPEYAELLKTQADMLRHLSTKPAHTLWEAIQLVLIVHCMMQMDFRYAMAFGRADQFLYPYYLADLKAERITKEDAQALLDHFIAKLAHRGDIQNICVGGVDSRGHDATNDLSYMIVNAVMGIGKPGGNLTARINKNTPHSFLVKCAESIRTGIGFPAVFNDEVQIPALIKQGWPVEDARNYCFVGCIEIFAQGKQAPWSDSRFNVLQCVDLALRSGIDGLTGKQIGLETGEPQTWDEFYQAFLVQMRAGVKAHVDIINAMKRSFDDRPMDFTSPLMSALYEDCIGRGLDQCMGGTVYPSNHGVASMGIGSVADSMMALKKFVYNEKRFTLDEIRAMLDANFEGYEKERMLLLKGSPKYGNDNEEVDAIAVEVVKEVGEECMKYRTTTGGVFWCLMAANISNIYAGREVGATPDGRFSQQPLSDAGSPTFGRDENGPTAVIRSVSKVDYTFARGGNVVNMKFSPSALKGEAGLDNLANLIMTCFDLGGIQLQFNTTDRDVLKKAMDNPAEYSNLVVRVSGFSAYYTALAKEVQEDILSRTEHTGA